MKRERLLKIKSYLEKISYINGISSKELESEWRTVYAIVYLELNGHLPENSDFEKVLEGVR